MKSIDVLIVSHKIWTRISRYLDRRPPKGRYLLILLATIIFYIWWLDDLANTWTSSSIYSKKYLLNKIVQAINFFNSQKSISV